MTSPFSESIVEDATLAWLEELGYAVLHGPDIGIGEPGAERIDPNYRAPFSKAACGRRW